MIHVDSEPGAGTTFKIYLPVKTVDAAESPSALNQEVPSGCETILIAEDEPLVRGFIDRVKTASYGYAGFFDAVRINSNELQKLYAYDLQMLEDVSSIASAVDNVEASMGSDGLPAAMRHLTTLCQELVDAYDRRDEVLLAL